MDKNLIRLGWIDKKELMSRLFKIVITKLKERTGLELFYKKIIKKHIVKKYVKWKK